MHPQIKAQWLTALRSGAYPQICGTLHDTDGFCCLGVLYDQHPAHQWIQGRVAYLYEEIIDEESGKKIVGETELTPGIRQWADLTDQDHDKVMELNDDEGQDFAAIADWIEENL